ncbi:protein-export membrane protein SecD [PVC group bacterium (ex Bugula neritina AB1)]|nr:protein-export membrane protein SecD [PVC group bacterium (ex Bugula neritina AB1)]
MNMSFRRKWVLIAGMVLLMAWKITPLKKAINLGLDLQGGSYLTLEVDDSKLTEKEKKDVVDVALEIIRNRVDEFGVAEPIIQKGTDNRLIVQVPGVETEGAQRIKNIIMRQAFLEFRLVVDNEKKRKKALEGKLSPADKRDYELLPMATSQGEEFLLIEKTTYLTGDMLTDAIVAFDQGGFGGVSVSLEFNKKGARRFEKLTGDNVNRRLAIVLDGKVQSAPAIKQKIPGGRAQISGSFGVDEAKDLAISLRAGALPAPIKILQESTVGPSLGADSIKKGMKSALLGLILVILFMLIYYKGAGLIANVSLLLNILFVVGILSFFDATLTLPGIAGIILTIGMAVDANVLIFERIREELRQSKTVKSALKLGFDKAFVTIMDANLTTLITALILFKFGTGPIRGFAVTLSVGVLSSMFTALFVSRAIFDLFYRKSTSQSLSI